MAVPRVRTCRPKDEGAYVRVAVVIHCGERHGVRFLNIHCDGLIEPGKELRLRR